MKTIFLALRRLGIAVLERINPGNITIRHHYTGDKLTLHSFQHKGYWFYGRRREQETMQLFAKLVRPGDTVIEVGGHIGYISLYFARLVGGGGRVVVFEPGTNNLPYIRENIRNHPNITLVEKAVSNAPGTARFYIENLTGQNNSLLDNYEIFNRNVERASVKDVQTSVIEVDCVTLDGYLSSIERGTIGLIKIDVEGAESLVLGGMSETLKRRNVALMVEVTRAPRVVFDLLAGFGYRMFRESRQQVLTPEDVDGNLFCIQPTDARIESFTT